MSENFTPPHAAPGAAPGGQTPVLLQYTIHARVFRLRVLLIFLGVACLFGLVAWLFFVPTFFGSSTLSVEIDDICSPR